MPKLVDHDERRSEIADAVLRIVARAGIPAVTVRAVAEESGWSTGVLTHYFGNRRGMLLGALRRAAEISGQHHKTIAAQNDGLARLEGALVEALPLDERRLALGRVFVFFYAEAATDESMRTEIEGYLAVWRKFVANAVRAAQRQGLIDARVKPAVAAAQLVALTDGWSIHALLDGSVMADLNRLSPVRSWIELLSSPATST